MNEGSADGTDSKAKSNCREKPPRANPFANQVGRDLEENVRYVKYREDLIIVIAF